MTKSEVEAFLAVVHYGSISAAAEQLYITQPALSRRIQNLEAELDYQLIHREKGIRGITLTERGKAFLSVARKWNAVYQEALAIKHLDQNAVLRIASVGSVSAYILPELFQKFSSKNSSYNLEYHSCHSWEGYSLADSGSVDLVFIDFIEETNAHNQGNVISIPIYSVPFVFLGGPDWIMIDKLHPSKLDPKKEILLSWNTAFDRWHKYWFDVSVSPKVKLDHVSVLKDVLQDDLFAIVPRVVAKDILMSNPKLTVCELLEGPPAEVIHGLTSVACQQKNQVQDFLNALKSSLQKRTDIDCLMK